MPDTHPLTPRQARFLQNLADSSQRLFAAIAGLNEATLCDAPVYDDWTAKDIFGHLVSWDAEFHADIQIILLGGQPSYLRRISADLDFTEWNLAQRALYREMSWSQTLTAFAQDIDEARALILSLSPKDYRRRGVTPWKIAAVVEQPPAPTTADTESVETLVSYHWRHWNQHAAWIERWRNEIKIVD
jgi:hypothetical protein